MVGIPLTSFGNPVANRIGGLPLSSDAAARAVDRVRAMSPRGLPIVGDDVERAGSDGLAKSLDRGGSSDGQTDQCQDNTDNERHHRDPEGDDRREQRGLQERRVHRGRPVRVVPGEFGVGLPPVMFMVCLLITIAWQYAENGPLTSSPAKQSASAETTIFWSDNVLPTTTQVTTPATAMMVPTMMAVIAATFRMADSPSDGVYPLGPAE